RRKIAIDSNEPSQVTKETKRTQGTQETAKPQPRAEPSCQSTVPKEPAAGTNTRYKRRTDPIAGTQPGRCEAGLRAIKAECEKGEWPPEVERAAPKKERAKSSLG